ncbi:hypothetical protein D3C75_1225910 [compost metagenome]
MIQRAGAEIKEEYLRLGIGHHPRVIARRLQQHRFHLVQIRSVGYANLDQYAGDGV